MRPTPISLRQLRQELTGIRLASASDSLWQITVTINDRARLALNDAIRTFPVWIKATTTSIQHDRAVHQVALPFHVETIDEINAFHASDSSQRVQVTYWRHHPSAQTNMLRVQMPEYWPQEHSVHKIGNYWLTIDYRHRLAELPEKRRLADDLAVGGNVVPVTYPGSLPGAWLPTGYVEIVKSAESANETSLSVREIAYYSSIDPRVGFYVPDRNQLGAVGNTAWLASDIIDVYPVAVVPPEHLAVIMAQAQANMYDYLVSNRTMYDQYITVANIAQIDTDELLRLVRTYEIRAQERYDRLNEATYEPKKLMTPSRVAYKRRKDNNA